MTHAASLSDHLSLSVVSIAPLHPSVFLSQTVFPLFGLLPSLCLSLDLFPLLFVSLSHCLSLGVSLPFLLLQSHTTPCSEPWLPFPSEEKPKLLMAAHVAHKSDLHLLRKLTGFTSYPSPRPHSAVVRAHQALSPLPACTLASFLVPPPSGLLTSLPLVTFSD